MEGFWQQDIIYLVINYWPKKRSYFLFFKTSQSAADFSNEELLVFIFDSVS